MNRPRNVCVVLLDSLNRHLLGAAGVTSYLVTDHPHLFETGGENYHTDFSG